ncbi:MAG: hypothetical protein AAFO93_13800 [Pseudomonadota bacterium]
MRPLALLSLIWLTACARALTPQEAALTDTLFGPTFDAPTARLVADVPMRGATINLPPRPRVTCQEKVVPPRSGVMRVEPAAVVIFNRMYMNAPWSLDNFVPDYPHRISLYETMLFAHEMTHIWQWQNRDVTGYHPFKAAREHVRSDDPYLFDPDSAQPFLNYGYEQQAALVEEYVCCAVLEPNGARTERLRALINQAIPVRPLPKMEVSIAWPDAPRSNLCD